MPHVNRIYVVHNWNHWILSVNLSATFLQSERLEELILVNKTFDSSFWLSLKYIFNLTPFQPTPDNKISSMKAVYFKTGACKFRYNGRT